MPVTNASEHEAGAPLKIAYVLKMFPRLSETFILNEILQLEALGHDVSVFSLMHPNDGRFHGRLASLNLTVDYFLRDRSEGHWDTWNQLPEEIRPTADQWIECAQFLRRHSVPKELELAMRAALIAAEVRRRGIQHIHAHFATIATRVAAMVSEMTGATFSFTSHAKDIFRETVDRNLYKELVDRSAFNITVSDFNREYILERTPGIDADKVIRLYNGIDLDYFELPTPKSLGSPPHLVSVGRLVPKKGFDFLLKSLAQRKAAGGAFRATIVGGGELHQELPALCTELGLDDEVTFTGPLPQEEVRRIVGGADVSVLACVPDELGNMDALPTTLLESLALGIPIVSTHLTGVPEIVGSDCGELAPHSDVDALTAAIDRLLSRMAANEIDPTKLRERADTLFHQKKNVSTLAGYFEGAVMGAK